MTLQTVLTSEIQKFILNEYQTHIQSFEFQQTRKEFKGDITLVVFPLLRFKKGNPAIIAEEFTTDTSITESTQTSAAMSKETTTIGLTLEEFTSHPFISDQSSVGSSYITETSFKPSEVAGEKF